MNIVVKPIDLLLYLEPKNKHNCKTSIIPLIISKTEYISVYVCVLTLEKYVLKTVLILLLRVRPLHGNRKE